MEDEEFEKFYEKWKEGKVKALCEYCYREFSYGEGDFYYPTEEWICYECLERLEREEEDELLSMSLMEGDGE